ncbi:hypothetical protein PHYSODRAFT_536448, partial [Phytophthora sojae]
VGCASRRLNLAVPLYTAPLENALAGIQKLMVKLRSLNQAAKLRFKTTRSPVLRNDTRWSSTFAMLDRYVRLLEFIDREDDAVAELLPSPSVHKKLKGLLEDLKQFESVSKRLQSESVSLWEVRVMFDALIAEKPALNQYLGTRLLLLLLLLLIFSTLFFIFLGPRADIVASPDFESACVKIQQDNQHALSRQEKMAVRPFVVNASSCTNEGEPEELGTDGSLNSAEAGSGDVG